MNLHKKGNENNVKRGSAHFGNVEVIPVVAIGEMVCEQVEKKLGTQVKFVVEFDFPELSEGEEKLLLI